MTEKTIEQTGTADVSATSQTDNRKPMVSYFLAKDAIDDSSLGGFLVRGTASEETRKRLAVVREAGRDEGLKLHMLFRQPGGFSLLLVWAKPNYPLPRHSHGTDCLYYIATGSIIVGNKTLRAGDGFFVPRDCLYVYTGGPEGAEVLEIRHGVDAVTTVVPEIPEKRVQTELELVQANAERWKEMQLAPTFAANLAAS
jgi:hypothetical protein